MIHVVAMNGFFYNCIQGQWKIYLHENIPDGFEPLLQYFDNTYVSGSYRQIQPPQRPDETIPPIRIRRKPPMFATSIWNVHTITLEGGSRTNNVCEGRNNGFSKLVGHSHPTIWRAIDSIRNDQALVATLLLRDERVRRQTRQLQINLRNMCVDRRDGLKSVEVTLRGIGHSLQLAK